MNYVKTEAETVFMNHDPDIFLFYFIFIELAVLPRLNSELLKNTLSDKEI